MKRGKNEEDDWGQIEGWVVEKKMPGCLFDECTYNKGVLRFTNGR